MKFNFPIIGLIEHKIRSNSFINNISLPGNGGLNVGQRGPRPRTFCYSLFAFCLISILKFKFLSVQKVIFYQKFFSEKNSRNSLLSSGMRALISFRLIPLWNGWKSWTFTISKTFSWQLAPRLWHQKIEKKPSY